MWLGLARAFVHDSAVTKAIFGCKSVPEALGAQMNLVKKTLLNWWRRTER